MANVPWLELETLIRRDPAQRGVASCRIDGQLLAEGHLQRAAEHLAQQARTVALVTGFCVFDGQRWTAETDGPPGALYLARALLGLGIEVTILSDANCLPALKAGANATGFPQHKLVEIPLGSAAEVNAWITEFLAGPACDLTHLIAIERCGPSHTLESLQQQPRTGAPPWAEFEAEVPPESRNRCHNMRGDDVTLHTGMSHLLFEAARARGISTIGMADGGNEIGMGSIPWETLRQAIQQGPAGRIACRVPTDYTLLAGVSNWAAYALAAAVCVQRGRSDLLATWSVDDHQALITTLVQQGGAVDGLTRQRELSIDGLPLEVYLHTFRDILGR